MKTSNKCRALFWAHVGGKIKKEEFYRRLDDLENKQGALDFKTEDKSTPVG